MYVIVIVKNWKKSFTAKVVYEKDDFQYYYYTEGYLNFSLEKVINDSIRTFKEKIGDDVKYYIRYIDDTGDC